MVITSVILNKVKDIDSGFKLILLLFIIITIVKIAMSLYMQTPIVYGDEAIYDSLAHDISHGQIYTKFGQTPPGYPLVLSIAHLLTDNRAINYHLMLVINSILSSAIIFPSYFILKRYSSDKIPLLGSLLIVTLPCMVLYSFLVMSENLFITLFAFSFWFIIESYETNNYAWQIMAGISVVFLYMTRSLGIAAMIGLGISFVYFLITHREKNILSLLYSKIGLLLPAFLSFLCWIIFTNFFVPKGIYNSWGTPYTVGGIYTNLFLSVISNLGSFISFLGLFLHEVEYFLLSTYFIVLILALFFIASLFTKKNMGSPLTIATIYFLVTSLVTVVITLTQMYFITSVQQADGFEIFGRYIDPLVPVIFLFGLIYLSYIYDKKAAAGKKTILIFIITYLIAIYLFINNFPYGLPRFGDTISIIYAELKPGFFSSGVFISLFFLASIILCYVSIKKDKLKSLLFIFLILSSTIFTAYSFIFLVHYSNNMWENDGQIVSYIQTIKGPHTNIYMSNNVSSDAEFYYTIIFWTDFNVSLNHTNDTRYIISQEILPYKEVARTAKTGFMLYMT